jgi:hypothetical protein
MSAKNHWKIQEHCAQIKLLYDVGTDKANRTHLLSSSHSSIIQRMVTFGSIKFAERKHVT